MTQSILIAEDEKSIAQSLSYCLEKEGFITHQAYDGQEALTQFKKNKPTLVLLDLMLPKLDGREVCRAIRRQSLTPIIMLTAKDSELDKIVGLEIGADDYITKPFSMRELVARINAVLRRSSTKKTEILKAGPFVYDEDKHEILLNNQPLVLPLKEFDILKILLLNRNKVVPREEILKAVWGEDFYGDDKTLDVHIRRLRQKIEADDKNRKYIKTIRGVGYRLIVSLR